MTRDNNYFDRITTQPNKMQFSPTFRIIIRLAFILVCQYKGQNENTKTIERSLRV